MIEPATFIGLLAAALALMIGFGDSLVGRLKVSVEAQKADLELKTAFIELSREINTERGALTKRVAALEEDNTARGRKIADLELALTDRDGRVAALEQDIARLNTELDDARIEIKTLREANTKNERALREAAAREKLLNEKIDRLESELTERDLELNRLRNKGL